MNDKHSILITDDNPENIKVLSSLLRREGYRVRIATNGDQAVKSVGAEPPDLILMDIQMPGTDGYEACRRIKSNEDNKNIPILFISAMSEAFNKTEAFKAGGVDYITKPFHAEEVLARVKTHLNLYENQRQLKEINLELFKQFKSSFEQAAVGMVHANPGDGRITKVNRRMCSLLGYTSIELLCLTISDVVHPEYLESEKRHIKDLIEKKCTSFSNEFLARCKDNSYIWLKNTVSLVSDTLGEPDYLVGILEDISIRKGFEEKLVKSEEKFRGLIETASDAIIIVNDKHEIIQINQQCKKLFGYEPEELFHKEIELLIPKQLKSVHEKHRDEYIKKPKRRITSVSEWFKENGALDNL